MTTRTHLVLVRHGETLWNLQGRAQGQGNSPLSDLGLRQAKALADYLAAEHFDALYTSDLARARQTAKAIAGTVRLPLNTDKRLRERHFGIFEGLTRAEQEAQYPEEFRRHKSGDDDYCPPGGESRRTFLERVANCMEDLSAVYAGRRVLAVTHGGVLYCAARYVLRIPSPVPMSIHNASINRFSVADRRWVLESWGEVQHIRELGETSSASYPVLSALRKPPQVPV